MLCFSFFWGDRDRDREREAAKGELDRERERERVWKKYRIDTYTYHLNNAALTLVHPYMIHIGELPL